MDVMALLKLLLDPRRLAVIGAIALEPRGRAEIEELTGVDRRTVNLTLGALRRAGALAGDEADRHRLDPVALRALAHALPQPDPPSRHVFRGMTEEEADILARFFQGDRLVEIPASWQKRMIVLERLALEFEPGRHYTEAEVNAILGRFHEDHASLRRYLVDEGLLDRRGGRYWRSGGRVL